MCDRARARVQLRVQYAKMRIVASFSCTAVYYILVLILQLYTQAGLIAYSGHDTRDPRRLALAAGVDRRIDSRNGHTLCTCMYTYIVLLYLRSVEY